MVVAAPEPKPAISQPAIGEKRVVLSGLSWEAYIQFLNALPSSRGSKLTYDNGLLEITKPLEDHEFAGRLIERFILTLVEVFGLRVKTMGSTTLNYPYLKKGAEPDNAYYIQKQNIVKGRNVDLAVDPPPDLVVEVDITHTDIKKNQFYAGLGIPEFWRFNGKTWHIYQLQENVYVQVALSPTFPRVSKEQLYGFLKAAKEDEIEAVIALREQFS